MCLTYCCMKIFSGQSYATLRCTCNGERIFSQENYFTRFHNHRYFFTWNSICFYRPMDVIFNSPREIPNVIRSTRVGKYLV